ncbi:hypothetical protein EVAR_88909_1 [Eumeta japonica]|uniref:Uncharacterized protein n=1 Tax=Eumeta variegata TaxID=151549 RepID=A0A4C1VP17_EUMVA|nr:hypothetical protein EVAR_88909_1 [Eumeta japonica]
MHNVRPSRILTRRWNGRSREILCVVRENDDAEWLDETDVDLQQSIVPTTNLQDAYPVIGVEESLANPWIGRIPWGFGRSGGRVLYGCDDCNGKSVWACENQSYMGV